MSQGKRLLGFVRLIAAWLLAALLGGAAYAQNTNAGGGGSAGPSYTLVDLVSPYHAADGGWSDTQALRVSRRATPTSPLYVVGSYYRQASGPNRMPCVWTVSPSGAAVVADLAPSLSVAGDVNSSGIIGGIGPNKLPSVRFPSGLVVSLPTPGGTRGNVTAITELSGEPGSRTFRAVGNHGMTSALDAFSSMWILSESGEVLDTIPLRSSQGTNLGAWDINADHRLAGTISVDGASVTATAELTASDLLISPLVLSYPVFVYLWEAHINNSGDVMAEAGEPIPGRGSVYRRTFVWPASSGMINLSNLNGGSPVAGEDIATVNGELQIVGEAHSSKGWFAFLYSEGQLRNINNLVSASGWNLWGGRGISNDGHIVGVGRITVKRSSQYHGFLLIKP